MNQIAVGYAPRKLRDKCCTRAMSRWVPRYLSSPFRSWPTALRPAWQYLADGPRYSEPRQHCRSAGKSHLGAQEPVEAGKRSIVTVSARMPRHCTWVIKATGLLANASLGRRAKTRIDHAGRWPSVTRECSESLRVSQRMKRECQPRASLSPSSTASYVIILASSVKDQIGQVRRPNTLATKNICLVRSTRAREPSFAYTAQSRLSSVCTR